MTYKATLSMRRQLVVFTIAMVAYHVIFTIGMAVMAEPSSPHVLTQLTLGGPTYFVSVLALVCGANLGRERSQYAPVALLFPLSRIRQALITFAVDIGGLAVAYTIACALDIGAFAIVHVVSSLHGGSLLGCVIIPAASIVALYGLSALLSVAVGFGRVVGPTLAVICFIALMLTAPDVPAHRIFQWFNLVNPVIYLYLASMQLLGPPPMLELYRGISLPTIATALTGLALSYLSIAVLLFRRVRSSSALN